MEVGGSTCGQPRKRQLLPWGPKGCYSGLQSLVPGALLAVPSSKFDSLRREVQTVVGQKILEALTYYGDT